MNLLLENLMRYNIKMFDRNQTQQIMKTTHFLILTFGLILSACSNLEASNAAEKESNDKHKAPEFYIEFPKTNFVVKQSEFIDKSQEGVLITNSILQGANNGKPFMYFVSHNEVPQKIDQLIGQDSNSLNTFFQAALTSSAAKLGGTDFEFTEIMFAGNPGMESVCSVFNGDGFIKSKIYKIENFVFMISGGGKDVEPKSVDDFINSFELKND